MSSEKILLFKNLLKNPAKASFLYQQLTAAVRIFVKIPTTDYLVFFSKHFLRSAILIQGLVITCK